MLHALVFHNDRILPMNQARLSPGQAGIINGWGLFSTLRIYDGCPFAFERHWNRLMTDAARLNVPARFSPAAVLDHMRELIAANGVSSGCVRVYLIHNKVGIWRSDEAMPEVDLLMYTSDLPNRSGVARLALVENGRHAAHPLAGVKVTSWLQNAWMFEHARQRGCDDALLLNEHGRVSECTAANIFCVSEGTVLTPPLSAGCLPGVTRQILLEIAPAADVVIVEEDFGLDLVQRADEMFLTSTTRQVQGIRQIEGIAESNRVENTRIRDAPGPVTSRLARLFSEYVAEALASSRDAAAPTQAG